MGHEGGPAQPSRGGEYSERVGKVYKGQRGSVVTLRQVWEE